MESTPPEDSKSSTDESDKKEQVNDDAGTGRFYECVFCKRGFNTAQALGGHMNIHRRDKAKNKQPTTSSKHSTEDFSRSGVLHPIPSNSQFYSPGLETQGKSDFELISKRSWDLNLFDENPLTNLSLQIGPTTRNIDDKQEEKQKTEEDEELDLELRLGHDP
ncbi:hypothetical protein ACHQM5_027264 [Ranunculus cassubicifolius]